MTHSEPELGFVGARVFGGLEYLCTSRNGTSWTES